MNTAADTLVIGSGIASRRAATVGPLRSRRVGLPLQALRKVLFGVVMVAVIAMFVVVGWRIAHHSPYTPGSRLGYAMGLTGALMMFSLLLYPLRKHLRFMQGWGPLKHWFRLHMIAGIAGPVLVLFHSTFRAGSLNAAVALGCMLLVVASGLVGRFLYRKIHHGLYGSRATLDELQKTLEQQFRLLESQLDRMPAIKREVERFAALASAKPSDRGRRITYFISLGWKRLHAQRQVRRDISALAVSEARARDSAKARIVLLLRTIDATLRAAQRTAQFTTYERLFSLWHVLHIPFLCMLVVTAVIHVVAVHVY
jgi:hypothetical protein